MDPDIARAHPGYYAVIPGRSCASYDAQYGIALLFNWQ